MLFLCSLVGSVVFALALKKPIKHFPYVFYALAIALVVVFLGRDMVHLPALIDRPFFLVMQKCTLAEALFVVVMFIGVFAGTSPIRSYLMPIRAELSIIACLLAVGHIVAYLGSFGARILLGGTAYGGFVLASFCVSMILFALLIVLGVTSFDILKRKMGTRTWKRIQWFAYPFFLLTWVHALLFLLPPAVRGGGAAQVSIVIYSVVFVAYLVLRIRARCVYRIRHDR
jgi:DMSO/TMAO reductase YedYZ heme-binding membrane subunit